MAFVSLDRLLAAQRDKHGRPVLAWEFLAWIEETVETGRVPTTGRRYNEGGELATETTQLSVDRDWRLTTWPLAAGKEGWYRHTLAPPCRRAFITIMIDLDALRAAAALPSPAVETTRRRRGPISGTIDRYGEKDRQLLPDLCRLMRERTCSATVAAGILAEEGKIAGHGSKESKARRLVGSYYKHAAQN